MAEEPPVVRPSSPLIHILNRKLRDPGIVPSFERHRARSLIEGLVRPHWVLLQQQQPLLRAEEDAVGAGATGGVVEENDVTGDGNGAVGNAKDDDCSRNNVASVDDDVGRSGKKCIPVDGDDGAQYVNGDAPKTNPATNCKIPKRNPPRETCDNNNVTKSETITTNSNQTRNITEYNTIPARNYIDLRMEQNRMFADSQCLQCQVILSKLFQNYSPPIELTAAAMASSANDKQWKKQADTIQSLINEGLAACPTHQGLLGAERKYKNWIQRRIDSITSNRMGEGRVAVANTAGTGEQGRDVGNRAAGTSGRPVTGTSRHTQKKGAEGRAHAAMRDALLERSFFLGDDNKDHDGKGGVDKSYPLLLPSDKGEKVGGEGDDGRGQEFNKKGRQQRENGHGGHSDSCNSSIADSRYSRNHHRHRERRRDRSRTSGRNKKDGSRREKRRRRKSRRYDDDYARRKEERGSSSSEQGSRSRSRSISSSMSRSSSSSASSCRRRKHRRRSKERKRKKHRRRRHHRRSRSSTKHHHKNEEESKVNNDVDYAGDEKKGNEDVLVDKMQASKQNDE
mmetsp:Transcript_8607/g.18728  ORF Transcript_8607/g.18728 Transcript_8607/m.18728 type:complete len:566 (+) Transcript_8607:74-1771(+)